MPRFHISNGVPSRCKAKPGNCPLGGEHYETLDEASRAAEDAAEREILLDKAREKNEARGMKGNKADTQTADKHKGHSNSLQNLMKPVTTSDLDDYVAAHRSEPEFESVATLYRESERQWWAGSRVSKQTLEERLDRAELQGLRKLAALKLDVSEEDVAAADRAKCSSRPITELSAIFIPGGAEVALHPSKLEHASDEELKSLLRLPVRETGRQYGCVRMENDGSFSGYLTLDHLNAIAKSKNVSEDTKGEAMRRLAAYEEK